MSTLFCQSSHFFCRRFFLDAWLTKVYSAWKLIDYGNRLRKLNGIFHITSKSLTEELTMKKSLRAAQAQQKERLKVSADALDERIKSAPFGEKTKALARKWVQYESVGGVGLGIFAVTPVMERAEGPYLYDADGKEYLDFLSGFSVSSLGNNNKDITAIIQKQAANLTHFFDFPHVERVKLAEKLCQKSRISGKTKVVFGVTGSDAIELAVRAARYYTGNPYILTAFGDYHGVTYGTMGLTSKGNMQPYFHPVPAEHGRGATFPSRTGIARPRRSIPATT